MENPEQKLSQEEALVAKARANKKSIIGLIIAVMVIVIAVLAWMLIAQRGENKAAELAAKADIEQNDSIAMELYKEAANAGYKNGNRAKLMLAINLYGEGKYEEALKYLDGASIDDKLIAAGALSLQGDCYSNLENYADALKCYKKAVKKADKNPVVVPMLLVKEANIYRLNKDYKAEAAAYKQILDEYPQWASSNQVDIKKYYERAAASAR